MAINIRKTTSVQKNSVKHIFCENYSHISKNKVYCDLKYLLSNVMLTWQHVYKALSRLSSVTGTNLTVVRITFISISLIEENRKKPCIFDDWEDSTKCDGWIEVHRKRHLLLNFSTLHTYCQTCITYANAGQWTLFAKMWMNFVKYMFHWTY